MAIALFSCFHSINHTMFVSECSCILSDRLNSKCVYWNGRNYALVARIIACARIISELKKTETVLFTGDIVWIFFISFFSFLWENERNWLRCSKQWAKRERKWSDGFFFNKKNLACVQSFAPRLWSPRKKIFHANTHIVARTLYTSHKMWFVMMQN